MRVMIIDDDEGIAQALSAAVELHGDQAITVRNPIDTLEICLQQPPDLIFLDLLLSGMNGEETAAVLRNCNQTCDIPIILMSAHPSARTTASQIHADDFLAKPFSLEQVFSLLEKHALSA